MSETPNHTRKEPDISPLNEKSFETQVPDNYSTLPSRLSPLPATKKAEESTTASISTASDSEQDYGTCFPGAHTVASEPINSIESPTLNSVSAGEAFETSQIAPTQRNQGALANETAFPADVQANYATIVPSTPVFDPLDPPTQFTSSKDTGHHGFNPTLDLPKSSSSRFRILREHAKGGLGKVYVAEDLELGREVAFKEIQRHFADDLETQIRFLREAKITGGLEHPGIVPIYGLGTHSNGRPYYAMRFIRGSSLQQAIEAYHRPLQPRDATARPGEFRQLLRRFIDVCNALEFAHAQGIIHRDLKPGNIMLGEYGETLVVDWGLAKSYLAPDPMLDSLESGASPRVRLSRLSDDNSMRTMAGTSVGTPQFMSPEQARGVDSEIGPPSDIYSLGATLYCILTGAGAFSGKTLQDVLHQVTVGHFLAPRAIRPEISKALNAICLKAMALQPGQRYASARALAADIEHYLADEPVEAYEESRREKFNRWVRKHQARAQAIGLSVIAIAAVSIIAAVLIDQSRRSEAEAQRSLLIANTNELVAKQESLRRSRQTRESIDTMLSGMSDALDAFPGMQDARRRLLERATLDYAKMAEEKSEDPELQAEAARNQVRLGDVRFNLNFIEQAQGDYKDAAEVFKRLSKQYPNVPDYRFELAQTYTKHGLALATHGQHTAANERFQKSLEILRSLVREQPRSKDYLDGMATALIGAGRASDIQNQVVDAERFLSEGLKAFQELRRQYPDDSRTATTYTEALSARSRFLVNRGRAAEAVKLLEDSLVIHDEVVAEYPDHPEFYANRATALINLAETLKGLGRWPNVARNYKSAMDDYEELRRAQPDVPLYRENLAIARANLGQTYKRLGNNPAAAPVLEKALQYFIELGASFALPRYVEATAVTRLNLAQVRSELGNQDDALDLAEAAMADYRELIDADPEFSSYLEGSAIAQSNHGRILSRHGDVTSGVAEMEAAIELLKAISDKEPLSPRFRDNLAWAWTHLGNVAIEAKQADLAKKAFGAAIDVRRTLHKDNVKSTQYQDALAWLLATCPVEELRDIPQALKLATSATAEVPDSPQYQLTLGAAQLMHHQATEALESLRTSRQLLGQDDGLTLYLQALGEVQANQNEQAAKTFLAAQNWRNEHKPIDEELARWDRSVQESLPHTAK